MTDLRDVVAELAERGTGGFRASYVAQRSGRDVVEVQEALRAMVDSGELAVQYQLLCPDDGAVLRRFEQGAELPIGQRIEEGDCAPFVVQKRHLWVAYVPTRKLLTDFLKEARKAGKTPARRRGLRRRARKALGIDWIRRQPFSHRPTTPS